MVSDDLWPQVEHAINNFPLMMGGIMAISTAAAAAGDGPAAPRQAGPMVRALIDVRLGKPQLDDATLRRVRAGLSDRDARTLIEACDDLAAVDQDPLPRLTAPLDAHAMLALIERLAPGQEPFDRFMHRFMGVAQRIQAIVQAPP